MYQRQVHCARVGKAAYWGISKYQVQVLATLFQKQLPAHVFGSHNAVAQILGPCHPPGETLMEFWASGCDPAVVTIWRNELVARKALFLSLILCLLTKQVDLEHLSMFKVPHGRTETRTQRLEL